MILAFLCYNGIKNYYNSKYFLHVGVLKKSNHARGVSIIAPAFNEENTVVYNIKSLMLQEYPKYEVVIVNDGSSDTTLEKIITNFDMVKVDFFYREKIVTQQVRGHYKSTNPVYSKLLVVDKVNGKSKADATNAGINSSKYDFFINTDVDCILRKDTISMLIKPFIENSTKVIASGAAIRISNSCEFKDGMLYKSHYPTAYFPMFQELEYIRAFIFGRMAWGRINGLLLVSGGLGLFDKELVVKVGGYFHKSIGEDMDLVIRMRKYMHDINEPYLVKYIPESLCWTEGPGDKQIFLRQRVRWARGLIQTLYIHRIIFFNPKYGVMGLVSFPYFVFCEFMVPILEFIGIIVIICDILFFSVNFDFLFVVTLFIYLFYVLINLTSIYLDQILYKHFANIKQLLKLLGLVLLEPFLYHPITIYSSLKGYWMFISNKELKWGVMTRQGFLNADEKK
jgi:cellulose synthase/poly-beta-1,6-N-acetylglucosamine synthase-like glycosyltransferase